MNESYEGRLSVHDHGESDDVLFIETYPEPLAEILEWISGKNVSVRYWVSNEKATKSTVNEEFVKTLFGAGDSNFNARYSELTGYLWTDEDLNVGGHDLLDELKSFDGYWIILEIESE
jgi:hypothetical protein